MSEMTSRFAGALETLGVERADTPAITDLDSTWTFGDLAAHAAAIASQLLDTGAHPMVGLLTDRHLSSVASVFGVLWAGRGFVVFDVNDPPDRIVENFSRAGVSIVLDATGSGPDRLGDLAVIHPAPPERDRGAWPALQSMDSEGRCTVQFTSGSTGRAKGVVKSFATFERSVDVFNKYSDFLEPKRTAVFMPLHFTAGMGPTVYGLTTGRFTMLVDPMAQPADLLLSKLDELAIERLHVTPSFLRSLSGNAGRNEQATSVDDVWLTGEPALWQDVLLARERFGARVSTTSIYGASEAIGARSSFRVLPGDEIGEGRLPIGPPVTPDAIRIESIGRDDGVGELIYRGMLADEYLDDPPLNAERFGVDPDGVRIWRSGDLVMQDESGVLHHRGRIDDMVKINGKLVEPAEPERVLAALRGVRNAVVLPRTLPSGRVQLVAHLETDGSLSTTAVRASLRQALPAHLVPAVLVHHEALPLNDRGKVNRAALLSALVRPWRDANPVPDGDRLVEAVLSIARLALEIDDIGADESLLDLGMDSLGAIEFVTLVNEAGEGHLEPNDLVDADTCRRLAERLRAGRSRRRTRSTTFNDDGREQPIFFVAGGGGFPLTYRALAVELGAERPLVVFEQRGLRTHAWPERTVKAAARHHLRELRRIRPSGPYLVAGHSYGGLVAHCLAGLLHDQGEDVTLLILDSVRHIRRDDLAPEAIRLRQSPALEHLVKWCKWRSVTAWRRLAGLATPIGSVERFEVFFQWALMATIRHRSTSLNVPTLALCVSDGVVREWEHEPSTTIVRVTGDHLSMLQPPHVSTVAQAMEQFIHRNR